jgi:hypothetical protein
MLPKDTMMIVTCSHGFQRIYIVAFSLQAYLKKYFAISHYLAPEARKLLPPLDFAWTPTLGLGSMLTSMLTWISRAAYSSSPTWSKSLHDSLKFNFLIDYMEFLQLDNFPFAGWQCLKV